jgi:hypothetical protein
MHSRNTRDVNGAVDRHRDAGGRNGTSKTERNALLTCSAARECPPRRGPSGSATRARRGCAPCAAAGSARVFCPVHEYIFRASSTASALEFRGLCELHEVLGPVAFCHDRGGLRRRRLRLCLCLRLRLCASLRIYRRSGASRRMRLRRGLLLQPPRGGVLCVLGRDSGGMKLLLVGVVWAGVVDVLRLRTRRHVSLFCAERRAGPWGPLTRVAGGHTCCVWRIAGYCRPMFWSDSAHNLVGASTQPDSDSLRTSSGIKNQHTALWLKSRLATEPFDLLRPFIHLSRQLLSSPALY